MASFAMPCGISVAVAPLEGLIERLRDAVIEMEAMRRPCGDLAVGPDTDSANRPPADVIAVT